MKITKIGATVLDGEHYVLVDIATDEGITGTGSIYSSGEQALGALAWLEPRLLGENPLEAERVTEKLHQMTYWVGRGGGMTHAISGINIALGDILGKATGQPVAVLLGGCYRRKVKPYASISFQEPGPLRATIEQLTARGFRAIKMGWAPFGSKERRMDEELIRAAREAAGEDVELMVDAGGSRPFWPWNVTDAVESVRMLAEYGITWFEEPLPPDDIEGYIELRAASPLKISGGEVLTRRQTFKPWLDRRALDIVQPDSTKVGGLSETRKIGWMAEANNILLVPHGWNTAIGVAADIHMVCALPNARWVEFMTGNRYIEELLTEPFVLDEDGLIALPEGPGLGVKMNSEAVQKFAAEAKQ